MDLHDFQSIFNRKPVHRLFAWLRGPLKILCLIGHFLCIYTLKHRRLKSITPGAGPGRELLKSSPKISSNFSFEHCKILLQD
jgi:hypothetical protein